MLMTAMYVVKEQSERYEALETLSEGAMGTVALARDRQMDRFVAIKSVKFEGVADAEERRRLQDALRIEAQVIQLLSHPNIVKVHEVIHDPGDQTPAVVMEYVQGSTLAAYLKGGKPLPLDFALSIALQIARALEHAHSTGVIHGDIKPSNILISDDGEQAKIADFGIARLMNERGNAEQPLFGTPRYIAPEQVLGHKADQRSDIFSLGVVLYEMLTGRSPFAGKSAREITQEIAHRGADLSSDALEEVPEPLRAVLRRALEREPAGRYQSARQMAAALENPHPVPGTDDTATTQDLSALVVPDLPDIEDESLPEPAGLDGGLPSEQLEMPPEADVDPSADSPAEDSQRAHAQYSSSRDPLPWPRWILIGLAAAIPTLLVGLLVIWLAAPESPPDGRFSEQHIVTAEVLPLFKEGRRQMLDGQTEVAIRLFRRAQDLAPASSDLALALARAEQRAIEQQHRQQQSAEIETLLTDSRDALDAGRAQQAARQATQALSLDPDNPEARALLDAASSQKARRSRVRTQPEPSPRAPTPKGREARPLAVPSQTPTSEPRASAPVRVTPPETRQRAIPAPGSVSTTADLRVDVFSYLSKGVLTVYAGQDQVLLEPFRFVQKSGFMRKKKTAGRLETSVELPSGPTEFRIYVSAEGQETQTVSLDADLTGGQTHVLRLIIAENGSASAQLN